MSKSFISSVRAVNKILFQYIDTETDVVTFCTDDKPGSLPLFTMDSDCNTFFSTPDNETVQMGKFGYSSSNGQSFFKPTIVFDFDPKFLTKHSSVKFKAITLTTGDFIEAEQQLVTMLLTLYPSVFSPASEKALVTNRN